MATIDRREALRIIVLGTTGLLINGDRQASTLPIIQNALHCALPAEPVGLDNGSTAEIPYEAPVTAGVITEVIDEWFPTPVADVTIPNTATPTAIPKVDNQKVESFSGSGHISISTSVQPFTTTPKPSATPQGKITLRPTSTPRPVLTPKSTVKPIYSGYIFRGNTGTRKVAITPDDGYYAEYIQTFIDVAVSENIRFTVFPTGQALNAFPALWRRLYALGCEFSCHTYTHDFNLQNKPPEATIAEITRSQQKLNEVLGRNVPYRYYRPPGGARSDSVSEALRRTGLRGVIWTLDSFGYKSTSTPESVLSRLVNMSGNGYIDLVHFCKNDAAALRNAVRGLRARGYTLTTLSQIL